MKPLLDKKMAIRGTIAFKKIFQEKYAGKFANARNLVSGIVNQTKNVFIPENIAKYKDIDFICYEILDPVLDPQDR